MKVLITICVLAFIAFMLYILFKVYSGMNAKKVLINGRKSKNFVYNYIYLRFSRKNVMKNINLPLTDRRNGSKCLVNIGLLFINQGGVFIINTVSGSGYVDVIKNGIWIRTLNDKKFGFEDPFLKNAPGVDAVRDLLKSEGIDNVPVYSVVVFSGRRVKFSRRLDGLVTAEGLTPYLLDRKKDRFLIGGEIRKIRKLIKNKNIVLRNISR